MVGVFRIGQDVRRLDGATFQQCATDDPRPPRLHTKGLAVLDPIRRKIVVGDVVKAGIILASHRGHICIAEPRRQFRQRIEDGLQIERGAADDLQNVGGRGLLLQEFAKLLGARRHFIEQPHILDCYQRLIRKGRDQFDLPLDKGLQNASRQDDHANRYAISQHGHAENGAIAGVADHA